MGCLVIFLASPFVLYFGYCWGLWGRHSILLQYHFQCKCPAVSLEARYSQQVDVIVSACSHSRFNVNISPSGRFLYVAEEISEETATTYLLDLQTRQKIDIRDQRISSFLTDDLWFLQWRGERYIIDRITGAKYPIEKFVYSRPNGQINLKANQPLLLESLRQSQQIFLIGPSTDTVVALAADFRAHPERNFVFDRFDLPDFNTEQFLQENGISYQTVLPSFPGEVLSPDGKLVARGDGIYVIATGEKIVEGFSASRFFRSYSRKYFSPRGWLYDGSGVIYSKFLNPCLIEGGFMSDDPGCFYEVPQPVILLKIPDEYLSP
jgi:hypothetical protein